MSSTSSGVAPASPREIARWLETGEIVLVDVREPSEYEVEHIAGALLLPLSSFEADLFPTLPGKKLVLHCAVGKRSEAAGARRNCCRVNWPRAWNAMTAR